jgi:hypothetical protein
MGSPLDRVVQATQPTTQFTYRSIVRHSKNSWLMSQLGQNGRFRLMTARPLYLDSVDSNRHPSRPAVADVLLST